MPGTTTTRRRRTRRTIPDAWTPEFTALVDHRTCDHGSTGPRYCALCKNLARTIANLTGVTEYR